MNTYPLPGLENERLDALLSCHILDTPREKEFDELVELVAQISGCQSATISFLDSERQWFKASFGTDVTEVPRNVSFCTYTILNKEVMVVENALLDPRFANNPAVIGPMHVRFYAGAPIVSSEGHNLGTVCVFDQAPKKMEESQLRALAIIAAQVTKLLELRIHNILIREQAIQRIEIEKKTVQHTLRQQEEERQSIGNELHENFGQVLAACAIYLNMAEEMEQNSKPFLTKARLELTKLIDDVRRLSRHVNPMSMHQVDFNEVLTNSVNSIRERTSFPVNLVFKGNAGQLSQNNAVTLLRVIIQYLELMSARKDILGVWVELIIHEETRLSIRFEANGKPEFSLFERVTINALLNRVESGEGVIHFTRQGLEMTLAQTECLLVS